MQCCGNALFMCMQCVCSAQVTHSSYRPVFLCTYMYGVATLRRLFTIIGLFGRISSLLQGSFAKETYNFKEPTSHSYPICMYVSGNTLLVSSCVMVHIHVCMGWLRSVGSIKL